MCGVVYYGVLLMGRGSPILFMFCGNNFENDEIKGRYTNIVKSCQRAIRCDKVTD